MRRLMYGFIMILFMIYVFVSCKTYTYVNENGIKIMLPKGAQKVDTLDLKNKYSNEFYQVHKNGYVYSWGHNFYLSDSIVLVFDYDINNDILSEKQQKDRLNILLYVCKSKLGKLPFYKYTEINKIKFVLIFYQDKQRHNTNDYFVRFETFNRKSLLLGGIIRFPATMSLEEIEKQTTKILSGVKLKN